MVVIYFTKEPESGKWVGHEDRETLESWDGLLEYPIPLIEIDIDLDLELDYSPNGASYIVSSHRIKVRTTEQEIVKKESR